MTTKKELAKRDENLPVSADILMDDAGDGTDAITPEIMTMPFINIAQDMSPQAKKNKAKYIEGCEPGMMFNSATNELTDNPKSMDIIVVDVKHCFLEWVPRESGGGFVAEHPASTPLKNDVEIDDKNNRVLPNGNHLNETVVYSVLDAVSGTPLVVSMSSSQLKVARRINSILKLLRVETSKGPVNPPSYYSVLRLDVVEDSNKKGDEYYNFGVSRIGNVTAEQYAVAKDFREMVLSGKAGIDHSAAGEDSPY